jgi:hypothetical protein
MLTRRRFASTVISLIAFGSGRWATASAAQSNRVSLDGPLTREVFLALLKDPFSLLLDNRAAEVVLVRVEDDGVRADSEQFTLLFEGPSDLLLLDGTYRIAHRTAGTTDVFLQPAGGDARHRYYKAQFNLLKENAGVPLGATKREGGRGWRVVP